MKTLLAYEPFHQKISNTRSMLSTIRSFSKKSEDVHVGFVATHTEPDLSLAFDVDLKERFSLYPKEIICSNFKKIKSNIKPNNIHVVDHETLSTTEACDQLIRLAKSKKADLIATYTQSLKGFKKFILGSFAQTLIHQSPIHVLLLNPKIKSKKKIKNVFVAIDFDEHTLRQIKKMIPIFKYLNAEVTFFHHAQLDYENHPLMDRNNPKIKVYRDYVQNFVNQIEKMVRAQNISFKMNVKTHLGSTVDLLFKQSKNQSADLIVVSSKNSPIRSLMGGSITRQLIGQSSCPVLVLK